MVSILRIELAECFQWFRDGVLVFKGHQREWHLEFVSQYGAPNIGAKQHHIRLDTAFVGDNGPDPAVMHLNIAYCRMAIKIYRPIPSGFLGHGRHSIDGLSITVSRHVVATMNDGVIEDGDKVLDL